MLKTCTLLLLSVAACGGADPAGDLVGRWELHDEDSGELQAMYAFDQDGAYAFREYGEGAESHRGTYEADGELLVMEGTDDQGADLRGEVTWFADDERFMPGALLPDGEVAGPVGRWAGRLRVEEEGEVAIDLENVYQLAEDGSATIESRSGDRTETIDDASWASEEGEIVVSFEVDDITFNLHLGLIDGAALGNPIFRRAAD